MGKTKYSTLATMKSIVTDDLKHCIECGYNAEVCHHCFEGANKRASEEQLLMIPMCSMCHMELHGSKDQSMNRYYKRLAQEKWEEAHPGQRFTDYFIKSYKED